MRKRRHKVYDAWMCKSTAAPYSRIDDSDHMTLARFHLPVPMKCDDGSTPVIMTTDIEVGLRRTRTAYGAYSNLTPWQPIGHSLKVM